MVDYLQLMQSPAYRHSREQEIADISRSLKSLAKELSVPADRPVAAEPLRRIAHRQAADDVRPARVRRHRAGFDLITFIYRDEVYNPDTQDKGVAEILIAKQRTGPTGMSV